MARITMPQLGETVTEGTVTRWLKSVGDHVGVDEPLLEVSTDKVETEIPSAAEGVLQRIAVAEGDTVPIGALLAVVGDDEPELEPAAAPSEHGRTAVAPGPDRAFREAMMGGQGYLHPPVQRHPRALPAGPTNGTTPAAAPAATPAPAPAAPPVPIDTREVGRREPFSQIRRATATHLTASLRTAAHTLTVIEADYTAVDRVRSALAVEWRREAGFSLSYLPFIARAACDALGQFDRLNASVDTDELVVHAHVNLGIAVDLDFQGLIVPVIRHAEELRLAALARAFHDVAGRARTHRLSGDDIAGGTFTITNAGVYGTSVTGPIINPPQVAILSTDGIGMRPAAVRGRDGEWGVAVRPRGNLSLSFDHRAVDGAYASAFLRELRDRLADHDWAAEAGGLR